MSTSLPSGIQFVNSVRDSEFGDARVVRIPAGIVRKRDLLTVLAHGLEFPKYFGWNWDAFEECLRDLSWIEESQRIILLHEGLPFQPDWANRATYMSILFDAVAASGREQSHQLIAVFPEQQRASVLACCS